MTGTMRNVVPTTLLLSILAAAYPPTASPLPDLPSEPRDGVSYIPSVNAIDNPNALESPAPEKSDHVRYDEFSSPLAEAEASWETPRSDSLPEPLRQADRGIFGQFVALFEGSDSPLGEITVGALPRTEEVPFALMPSDSERYEATVWSGTFDYALLYIQVNGSASVVDLGALYGIHLSEGSRAAAAEQSDDVPPAYRFLPAAPTEAGVTRFESSDTAFIDVRVKARISFDNPSMEPATMRVLLTPADDTVELAGLFVTQLSYPSGSSYSLHLEDTGDARGILREHMLSATPLTSYTTRYQLAIGEYRYFRGRFVRSSSSAIVWRETFPQTLVVAEEEAGLYEEPRGARIGGIARETRVRAVEPWDRLDSRDGVEGVWYLVETGDEQGWMWAPDLVDPESDSR